MHPHAAWYPKASTAIYRHLIPAAPGTLVKIKVSQVEKSATGHGLMPRVALNHVLLTAAITRFDPVAQNFFWKARV